MGIVNDYYSSIAQPEGMLGRLTAIGMNFGHARVSDWGMSHLIDITPTSILDIGCGGGRNDKKMLSVYPEAHLTAIDISPVAVEETSRVCRKAIEQGRCTVIEADAANLPMEIGSFDLITAFETVNYLPDLVIAFQEISRVMRSGGIFLIVNQGDGDTMQDTKRQDRIAAFTPYSHEQLAYAIRQAGLAIIAIDHDEDTHRLCLITVKDTALSSLEEGLTLVGNRSDDHEPPVSEPPEKTTADESQDNSEEAEKVSSEQQPSTEPVAPDPTVLRYSEGRAVNRLIPEGSPIPPAYSEIPFVWEPVVSKAPREESPPASSEVSSTSEAKSESQRNSMPSDVPETPHPEQSEKVESKRQIPDNSLVWEPIISKSPKSEETQTPNPVSTTPSEPKAIISEPENSSDPEPAVSSSEVPKPAAKPRKPTAWDPIISAKEEKESEPQSEVKQTPTEKTEPSPIKEENEQLPAEEPKQGKNIEWDSILVDAPQPEAPAPKPKEPQKTASPEHKAEPQPEEKGPWDDPPFVFHMSTDFCGLYHSPTLRPNMVLRVPADLMHPYENDRRNHIQGTIVYPSRQKPAAPTAAADNPVPKQAAPIPDTEETVPKQEAPSPAAEDTAPKQEAPSPATEETAQKQETPSPAAEETLKPAVSSMEPDSPASSVSEPIHTSDPVQLHSSDSVTPVSEEGPDDDEAAPIPRGNLTLELRDGDCVTIGDVEVRVTRSKPGRAKLTITAPRWVPIHRKPRELDPND